MTARRTLPSSGRVGKALAAARLRVAIEVAGIGVAMFVAASGLMALEPESWVSYGELWHDERVVLPMVAISVAAFGMLIVLLQRRNRKLANLTQSLRQSEGRYRILADNARDVVWTMDVDGTITYVSPAVEVVRGFTVEEAMRQPIHEILMPRSAETVIGYFGAVNAAIAAGRQPEGFRGDLEYLCKDGSTFWTEVIATPALKADGRYEIIGVTRDISDRKRNERALLDAQARLHSANEELLAANEELSRHRSSLEELVVARTQQLAHARDQAESANRAKSLLLMNISHELLTPLHHIIGFGALLRKEPLSDGARAKLDTIRSSAGALLDLINNLIETARLEADEIQLVEEEFSIADVLGEVRGRTEESCAAKGIHFHLETSVDLPSRLVGDAGRVARLLEELVRNAIKFSESGTITVAAFPCGRLPGLATLRFEIRDEGIGVAPDLQASIFQLFSQGDASSTRKYGGTGLGLALCRRLVNLMAGRIGLRSNPGEGSVFWVEIPFRMRTAEPPRAA